MSANPLAGISGGLATIGRYFTVVSLIPATLFAGYLFLLMKSGAWGMGALDWSRAATDLSLQDAVVFSILVSATALALHPLQYPLVRIMEGYWHGPLLASLAVIRIAYHRRRRDQLVRRLNQWRLHESGFQAGADPSSEAVVRAYVMVGQLDRALAAYPEPDEILPTRLGNVLRRQERQAGSAYGIESIGALPRLAMVAKPPELAYLNNQRTQLELALRTAILGLFATVITVLFMWWQGLWMFLAVVPYGMAYASYRGAVALAEEYGMAMRTLIDMSRFALYERLRLEQPLNSVAERNLNASLAAVFMGEGRPVDYMPPDAYETTLKSLLQLFDAHKVK
ncbi:hypothetical protein AB0I81_50275 [Nonomuraea sp. NPDC050404]|uniref:hypothetical protein n=1 Tax=Nonomuraea sp. NPDC050404 TaxID=3155783 RepID=UPI0033C404D5